MFQAHKLKYILKIYSLREDKAMTGNIINRAEAALTGKTVLKKLGIRKITAKTDGNKTVKPSDNLRK